MKKNIKDIKKKPQKRRSRGLPPPSVLSSLFFSITPDKALIKTAMCSVKLVWVPSFLRAHVHALPTCRPCCLGVFGSLLAANYQKRQSIHDMKVLELRGEIHKIIIKEIKILKQ